MSQFTQRMRGRKIAMVRQQAMESLTKEEAVFFGYKAIPFRGKITEEEMLEIAKREREKPTQWWHYLARVQTVLKQAHKAIALTSFEQDLVRLARRNGKTVDGAVKAVLAARRLGV